MHLFRTLLWSMIIPAAAAASLAFSFHLGQIDLLGMLLLLCGVMSAYLLDRWIDGRGNDGRRLRRILISLFCLTSAIGLLIAIQDRERIRICMYLALLGGGYVPLKKWIPKNVLTVSAWTIAIIRLPTTDLTHTVEWTEILQLVGILTANTILCDLPTIEQDRQLHVRGIATWLGWTPALLLAGIFSAVAIWAAFLHSNIALLAVACTLMLCVVWQFLKPEDRRARLAADWCLILVPVVTFVLSALF